MTAGMARVAAEHAAFVLLALGVVGVLAWRLALRISLPTERIAEAARAIDRAAGRACRSRDRRKSPKWRCSSTARSMR